MEKPQQGSRYKPITAKEALDLLSTTADTLEALQHLNDGEKRHTADAVDVLKTLQTTPKRKRYKMFLHNLLKDCGPHMILLCALALGQVRVVDMKKHERARLLNLIKEHTKFSNPIFRSLAIAHHVPAHIDDLQGRNQPEILENTGLQLPGIYEAETNIDSPTVNSGRTNDKEEIQFMFSNAPIERVPLLSNLVLNAIQSSRHWEDEREIGGPTTNCVTTMIPENESEDISITLWVGQRAGLQLLEVMKLQPTWSSLLGHLSP